MLFEKLKSYDTIYSQMSNLNKIQESYLNILKEFGVTSDEVLENTPARAAKAMQELLNGHDELTKISWKTFDIHEPGELVLIKGIAFQSLCEHHILPFAGTVSVAYIPKNKVVGLSKIPRLVKAVSHQLQLQERMTNQIADLLQEKLDPKGIAIFVKAEHACMYMRGICSTSETVTYTLRGEFKADKQLRDEFFQCIESERK